ncbi:hypothetical protein [Isachenkonia alkalipeptolytica]|uniref:hypothetical protein n=1 Tax=Isachenkonia alkalipeptolytica TaxID=2565777 RepID=UPI001371BF08|nr:hypothetical protein [Isachenkonia alkalipeptolytica]
MKNSKKPLLHGLIFAIIATAFLYLLNGEFSFAGIIGGFVWVFSALIIPVKEKK